MLQQDGLPSAQAGGGPVAVDALDAGDAVLSDFRQQTFGDGSLGVVGVDQDRQHRLAVFVCIHRVFLRPFRCLRWNPRLLRRASLISRRGLATCADNTLRNRPRQGKSLVHRSEAWRVISGLWLPLVLREPKRPEGTKGRKGCILRGDLADKGRQLAEALDNLRHLVDREVDLFFGVVAAQAVPNRAVGGGERHAHRAQHVRRLQ